MDGEDIKNVNFEEIKTMSFTVPVSFRFFRKQEKAVDSWKELYLLVMKDLARIHSECFCFGNDECVYLETEIGDLQKAKGFRKPVAVRRGTYIETELGTETILRRIRDVLVACQIPFSHLTILYRIDEERRKAQEERRLLAEQKPKVYTLDWNTLVSYNGAMPISYRYKNKRTRKLDSWAAIYRELLSDLREEFPRKIKSGLAARGRRSPDIILATKKNSFRRPQNIGDGLILETFGTVDALVDRMYYFLDFCDVEPEQAIIKFGFDDKQKEADFLEELYGKETLPSAEGVDTKILRRCKKLLKKYFPKGYRAESWIDMNKLRSRYQDDYKEELEINDEQLTKILLCIAAPLDGRIYAQTSNEQRIVLDEMLQLISSTFESGATCIYVQTVYERYKDALAEHFNIFSAEALTEMITAQLDKTYSLKRNYLCYGRRVAEPEKEIISEIKQHPHPLHISELTTAYWYIPGDKIEQILAVTDEIVNVGSGEYYDALNLPITKKSLSTVKQNLKEMLAVRDKITELEILNVVLQECPSLLEDIHFLTWSGFWKSLRYLLSDVITTEKYKH